MRKRHTTSDVQSLGKPIDANYNPVFRSEDFRSTLDIGWIPDHGIDFFTLFILDLHAKWRVLIEKADSHLSTNVSIFPLVAPGRIYYFQFFSSKSRG